MQDREAGMLAVRSPFGRRVPSDLRAPWPPEVWVRWSLALPGTSPGDAF